MNAQPRPSDAAIGRAADRPSSPSPAWLLSAWLFLVALAVVGRAWQPAPNVTPLAAVSMAAGALFPSSAIAASVPLAALTLGNLFLPPHDSLTMAVVVYVALAWPLVLGRLNLVGRPGRDTRWRHVIAGALASSLIFFFATNIAFWLLTDVYPRSPAGLLACLVAALPFHRWMPVGDVVWSLLVFGTFAGMAAVGDTLAARRLVAARVARTSEPTSAA